MCKIGFVLIKRLIIYFNYLFIPDRFYQRIKEITAPGFRNFFKINEIILIFIYIQQVNMSHFFHFPDNSTQVREEFFIPGLIYERTGIDRNNFEASIFKTP